MSSTGGFGVLKSKLESKMERLRPRHEQCNAMLSRLDATRTPEVKVGGMVVQKRDFDKVFNNLADNLQIQGDSAGRRTIWDKLEEIKLVKIGQAELYDVHLNFKESGAVSHLAKVEFMTYKDTSGNIHLEYCKFGEKIQMDAIGTDRHILKTFDDLKKDQHIDFHSRCVQTPDDMFKEMQLFLANRHLAWHAFRVPLDFYLTSHTCDGEKFSYKEKWFNELLGEYKKRDQRLCRAWSA